MQLLSAGSTAWFPPAASPWLCVALGARGAGYKGGWHRWVECITCTQTWAPMGSAGGTGTAATSLCMGMLCCRFGTNAAKWWHRGLSALQVGLCTPVPHFTTGSGTAPHCAALIIHQMLLGNVSPAVHRAWQHLAASPRQNRLPANICAKGKTSERSQPCAFLLGEMGGLMSAWMPPMCCCHRRIPAAGLGLSAGNCSIRGGGREMAR